MTRFSSSSTRRAGAPARRGSWSPSRSSHNAGRRGTLSLCWSIAVAGRYSACWSFPSNGEGGPVWPCVPLSSSGLEACKFPASITTCPAASLHQKQEPGASPTGKGLWLPSHLMNTKDSGLRGRSQGVSEEGKPAGLGPCSDPACLLPVCAGRSTPPAWIKGWAADTSLPPPGGRRCSLIAWTWRQDGRKLSPAVCDLPVVTVRALGQHPPLLPCAQRVRSQRCYTWGGGSGGLCQVLVVPIHTFPDWGQQLLLED